MRRREFIRVLGGAAVVWPLHARAQQGERMRRVGVLVSLAENDPEGQSRFAAFSQGMQHLGWSEARNLEIVPRWGAGKADLDRLRRLYICLRLFV